MIEVSLLVKATVVLALGLAVAAAARRARASVRHVWIAATLDRWHCCPFVAGTVPDVTIQLPERYASLAPPSDGISSIVTVEGRALLTQGGDEGATRENAAGRLPSWPVMLRAAWLGGAALAMGALALSLVRGAAHPAARAAAS
jgi:hypothetical protein